MSARASKIYIAMHISRRTRVYTEQESRNVIVDLTLSLNGAENGRLNTEDLCRRGKGSAYSWSKAVGSMMQRTTTTRDT